LYPERFFDILYQNDEMFKEDATVNTRFLPAVEFRLLYHCEGVTDTTRSAIWKYLQLILMTVLNSVRDKSAFGDAADMFEGVDESVLQDKLNNTLEEIGSFFRNLGGNGETTGAEPNMSEFFVNMASSDNSADDMPNANDVHEHLKGLFDGKIGSLAKELAEEISHDVEHLFDEEGLGNIDPTDIRSTGDLIHKMIKNPKKIMSLMKTISGKLQSKMKSGEISEEEIMREAGELMGKMKNMKGMGGMGDMFKELAKGLGKGGKAGLNMGALQRMQKQMATKERMRSKMEERAQMAKHIEPTADSARAVFRLEEEDARPEYSAAQPPPPLNDAELVAMFEKGDASKKKSKDKKKTKGK
jgi:hypothetical protein